MKRILQKWIAAFICVSLYAVMLAGCTAKDSPNKENTDINEGESRTDENLTENQTDVSDQTDAADGEDSSDAEDYTDEQENNGIVAVSMPDQSQRWLDDAANIERGLKAAGYQVMTAYAQNDAEKQAAQIQEFVDAQADCIVIAAADVTGLTDAAAAAAEAGIPIIAYDRLLMDTDAVSFYTSFDSKGAGILIGQTMIEKADLDRLSDGEYKTIEFFMGDSDDLNAQLLYNGMMEALQPYLDQGTLICKSGRTSMKKTSVAGESQIKAQKRCSNTLAKYYTDEDLDICVAASDILAYGCLEACKAAGYTVENWPLISGLNCELPACGNILEGTQSFSVLKDNRELAQKCVSMIEALLSGMEPEINDMEQYGNHVMTVPSYLCTPVVVDADNLEDLLIEGGYYTKEQIDSVQS